MAPSAAAGAGGLRQASSTWRQQHQRQQQQLHCGTLTHVYHDSCSSNNSVRATEQQQVDIRLHPTCGLLFACVQTKAHPQQQPAGKQQQQQSVAMQDSPQTLHVHCCIAPYTLSCRLLAALWAAQRNLKFWRSRLRAGSHGSFMLLERGPVGFVTGQNSKELFVPNACDKICETSYQIYVCSCVLYGVSRGRYVCVGNTFVSLGTCVSMRGCGGPLLCMLARDTLQLVGALL